MNATRISPYPLGFTQQDVHMLQCFADGLTYEATAQYVGKPVKGLKDRIQELLVVVEVATPEALIAWCFRNRVLV